MVRYVVLFKNGIEKSAKSTDVAKRLTIIEEYFTYSLYANVCRSLFEKDKLLFSFTLCVAILNGAGKMDMEEYNFLLTGGVSLAENTQRNPGSGWLADASWDMICRLGDLKAFVGER